jgi:transcriptional regulator
MVTVHCGLSEMRTRDKTTIQIRKSLKAELDKLLISKGETYDQIIARLVEEHNSRATRKKLGTQK